MVRTSDTVGTVHRSRIARRNTRRTKQPDRESVFDIIRDQLSDILEIDPGRITESSSFVEDLEADSLALIELVEGLEENSERTVGFRIEDEDLEDLKTVRDAIRLCDGPNWLEP